MLTDEARRMRFSLSALAWTGAVACSTLLIAVAGPAGANPPVGTCTNSYAPYTEEELAAFAPGSLIVDVSCDAGMGFSWARPTSFADPMFTVGDHVRYYAVDHSPSLLWDSATWEISQALLPHLPTVLDGPDRFLADPVMSRSVEVRNGVIQNEAILSFQHRSAEYPHERRG